MRRRFNITGSCNPRKHYMVRLDDRLKKIKEDYIDNGSYFLINRGRQFGKTTTLEALEDYLKDDYMVLSLDFQLMGTEDFSDETVFSHSFLSDISMALKNVKNISLPFPNPVPFDSAYGLKEMFLDLSNMCKNSTRPIILIIDEIDSASNNQVFIDFLAQLRGYYLRRDKTPIFHSVILAGVYDIKNLKLKLRPESEHQYNSPWNIAADFDLDMSFSREQISDMLQEYEADFHTGMEISVVADEIYQYTSGYPVLVSSICKFIDEKLPENGKFKTLGEAWSKAGIELAVKKILIDRVPLFESMIRHLNDYPSMKQMFQAILFQGTEFSFNPDTKEINLACMFGYAVNRDGKVQIANRIFEMRLYNYFLSEEELSSVIGNMAQETTISKPRQETEDGQM